jgi:hypothetical protein
MSKQPTRGRASRRGARTLAVGVAVAALVGVVGAGQTLAAVATPDERALERQRMIDRHRALGQLAEQGSVDVSPQPSSEDEAAAAAPAGTPRRFIPPEPPIRPEPRLGDQQAAPSPVRKAPAGAQVGLVVIVVVAALLLAVGAATTWRVRHRRPQPESSS